MPKPRKVSETLSQLRPGIDADVIQFPRQNFLPPELWKYIFRHAASERLADDWTTFTPLTAQKQYFRRSRTRYNLVLVCKRWRTLASDLLYESVLLVSTDQFEQFCRALEKDWRQSRRDQHNRHVGWFTKHLYIDFSSFSFQNSSSNDVKHSASALRLVANLEIIGICSSYFSAYTCATIVLEKVAKIGIPIRQIQLITFNQLSLIRTFNTLEVLSLRSANNHRDIVLSLPRLHTLEIIEAFTHFGSRYSTFYLNPQWELPSLRHIALMPSLLVSEHRYLPFFQRYGPQLISLDLRRSVLTCELSNLLHHCPAVTELGLYYKQNGFYPTSPNPFGNCALETLDVHVYEEGYTSHSVKILDDPTLHRFMTSLFRMCRPTWKRIRLTDVGPQTFDMTRWCKARIDKWKEWFQHWEQLGVRFEFSNGDLITVPPYAPARRHRRRL